MNFIAAKIESMKNRGESVKNIILYWLPDLVSNAILVSLPPMFDSWVITRLGSTTLYGALAMGVNFLYMLIKLAEAIPAASIAIVGRHNGAQEYEKCGDGLSDTFWTTFILGLALFACIFFGAGVIYAWLGVPVEMIVVGIPFLKAKAFAIFLTFITLGLLGFMRAVKNTKVPMLINLIGLAAFFFFDYVLVLGKLGFPKFALMGSAYASIIQYMLMNAIALGYILTNPDYKKYFSRVFFSVFSLAGILHLLNISWPIIIDKGTNAWAYVWLSKMLATMGGLAIVSYDVIKNLERFAFLPVIGFASIITFLVSNSLGAKDYEGAMANIKKVYLLAFLMVAPALLLLIIKSHYFVSIYDPTNQFTDFAGAVLPIISLLVFCDLTQVFLAGALRGAGDVRTVMWGRLFACLCFFVPISFLLSKLTMISELSRFTLIYSSFYLTTGLSGVIFLWRIKSRKWQKTVV